MVDPGDRGVRTAEEGGLSEVRRALVVDTGVLGPAGSTRFSVLYVNTPVAATATCLKMDTRAGVVVEVVAVEVVAVEEEGRLHLVVVVIVALCDSRLPTPL